MKFFKKLGKLITAVTGKPTTTKSVVGEVANVAARVTGRVDPETAEAIAEKVVERVKRK